MEIVRVRLVDSEEGRGCELAPVEIVKSLREIRGKENGMDIGFDSLRFEEIHVDLENLEEANHLIFENSKEIFEKNDRAFFIGGDHSISYSIVRAFDKVQEDGLLVVFDGRGDVNGIGGPGNNRNWLRRLIDNGFRGSRVVLVGVRNLSKEDREFLKEHRVSLIGMDVLQEDLDEVCDMIMERARGCKGFYVSVDVGCVDPSCAPGVNGVDVGGLSSREMIYLVKRLRKLDNFRGGDIVEVNPEKDVNGMTVGLASRLLGEMV